MDRDHANDHWLGLSGKVCAITGASGGIGLAIANAFSSVGAAVALLDRDTASCEALASQLKGSGKKAVAIRCDVTGEESIEEAQRACSEALGPADILVNNAAILSSSSLLETDAQNWSRVLGVNLTGYFLCAKVFGRQMKQRGAGSIVHVSSVAGHFPQPYSGAYSVSKAGVMMLSELLAVELGEFGVRSNVVSPAMIRTPLSEDFYKDAELLRRRTEMVPSRRIGKPDDIAEAILFLASERSGYVNGRELLLDGGLSRTLLTLIPRPGYERKAA